MGRTQGTFQTAFNFEVLTNAPLDARLRVSTKSDLTSSSTWLIDNKLWLYKGMTVSVVDDPSADNNGLYFLQNDASYNYEDTWLKINQIAQTDVSGTDWVSFQINRDENGVILEDASGHLEIKTVSPNIYANLRAGKITIDHLKLDDNSTGVLYALDGSVSIIDGTKPLKAYNGDIQSNGTATQFFIDHSLNTYNQIITIYENNQVVYPDIVRGENIDVVSFSYAPSTGSNLKVVILGF